MVRRWRRGGVRVILYAGTSLLALAAATLGAPIVEPLGSIGSFLGIFLYSRISTAQTLLASKPRERLVALVRDRPGICLTEAADRLDLARNAVAHHVRMLRRASLIEVVEGAGRKRLYLAGMRPATARSDATACLVGNPVRERVFTALAHAPAGVARSDLHAKLGDVPARTRNHALQVLMGLGLVEAFRDELGRSWVRLAGRARGVPHLDTIAPASTSVVAPIVGSSET